MLDDIGICMKSIEIGKQFSAFVCHLFACWLLGLQLEQKKWRLWQWPLSHAMSGRVSHFIMLHPNEEAHPIRFKSTWIGYDKNISKSYQNHKLPTLKHRWNMSSFNFKYHVQPRSQHVRRKYMEIWCENSLQWPAQPRQESPSLGP